MPNEMCQIINYTHLLLYRISYLVLLLAAAASCQTAIHISHILTNCENENQITWRDRAMPFGKLNGVVNQTKIFMDTNI